MDFDLDPSFLTEWATGDECRDVVTEAAGEIADTFDQIAPRDTGRMVSETAVHPAIVSNTWQAELVVNVPYAKFVEAGTRYMRAQHNLRHSMEIVESETRA